jgi:hypothetical protein
MGREVERNRGDLEAEHHRRTHELARQLEEKRLGQEDREGPAMRTLNEDKRRPPEGFEAEARREEERLRARDAELTRQRMEIDRSGCRTTSEGDSPVFPGGRD